MTAPGPWTDEAISAWNNGVVTVTFDTAALTFTPVVSVVDHPTAVEEPAATAGFYCPEMCPDAEGYAQDAAADDG